MPYNPSSAYPRHSTYTPPVYGRGFARAFNEPEWGRHPGRSGMGPQANVGHALAAAMHRPTGEGIAGVRQLQSHVGFGTIGLARAAGWAEGKRKENKDQAWGQVRGAVANQLSRFGGGMTGLAGEDDSGPPRAFRQPPGDLEDINAGVSAWPHGTGAKPTGPITTAGARGGRDPLLDSDPTPRDFGDPFADPSQTGGRAHVGGVNDRIGPIVQRVTTSSTMNDVAQRVLSGGIGGPMTVPKLIIGAARTANRRRKGA